MLKKAVNTVVTIFISLIMIFVVIQNMPGNPVDILAQSYVQSMAIDYDTAYMRAKSKLNYDPDKPLMQRFTDYMVGIAKGNLGDSMIYHKPVIEVVFGALPWTLLVCSISLLLSCIIGVLIGIYIAWRQRRTLNTALTIYQSIFGALPDYIVGYVLIFIFAIKLSLLPSRGAYSSDVTPGLNASFILNVLQHAILPVFAYFITTVAGWALSMKANCLTVLGEDYMSYAKARGLSEKRILVSYLGRNAILPMVTGLAISFGFMFGGSPLIENLFLYPGVGYYLSSAISKRDFTLMQGMFLIIIIMVVVSSLIAEALYTVLNPRLKER